MKKQPISNKSFEKSLFNFYHKRMSIGKFNNDIDCHSELFENVLKQLILTYKANPFKRHSRMFWDSAFTIKPSEKSGLYFRIGYIFTDNDTKLHFKFMYKYPKMRKFKRDCQLTINIQ